MTKASDLLVVRQDGGAAFPFEGTMTYLRPGLVAHKGHPIVQGREAHFEPLVVHFDVPDDEDTPDTKTGDTNTDGEGDDEDGPKTSTAGVVKSTRAGQQGARAR